MKTLLISFLLMATFSGLTAQPTPTFPDDWLGNWQGELIISTTKGVVQQLPMHLEISKTDSTGVYHWLLSYGQGAEADTRPYTLVAVDTSKGHWLIDEHNSILLDGWVLGDTFLQYFTINGSYILLSLRYLGENQLLWEIIAGAEDALRESGGQKINEDPIPIVKSMQVSSLQRAVLTREE